MCFDIWRFKKANNSETGFGGHHCDFEEHVPCLTVHVCMNSVMFVLEAPGASVLWGATILWQCAGSLGGTSIREGTSNRDTTVIPTGYFCFNPRCLKFVCMFIVALLKIKQLELKYLLLNLGLKWQRICLWLSFYCCCFTVVLLYHVWQKLAFSLVSSIP